LFWWACAHSPRRLTLTSFKQASTLLTTARRQTRSHRNLQCHWRPCVFSATGPPAYGPYLTAVALHPRVRLPDCLRARRKALVDCGGVSWPPQPPITAAIFRGRADKPDLNSASRFMRRFQALQHLRQARTGVGVGGISAKTNFVIGCGERAHALPLTRRQIARKLHRRKPLGLLESAARH
jgi:hypothetical protein